MYTYSVKIVKIVDGDTVDVDIDLGFGVWLHNQRIRLSGIDAPESNSKDILERACAKAAKERVESLLPVGSKQTLISTDFKNSADKYGRILGEFKVTNTTVNKILIAEHYAVPYNGENKETLNNLHLENQKILLSEGKIKIS